MWGKFVYREIVVPEQLGFINFLSDGQGNAVRAPFNQVGQLEVLNNLIFSEHDGKTTIEMRRTPVNATEKEQKAFDDSHKSLQQGFKATLDQLDEYLTTAISGESHYDQK